MVRHSDLIQGLPSEVPFVGPETQERLRGSKFQVRAGANESVFGPSDKAIEAMRHSALNEAWMYGDPENYELKVMISKRLNVSPDNIIVGEGIDGLLGYLVRLCVSPGTKVVTSLGAYPTFNYHVKGFGGDLIMVPYLADFEDIEQLLFIAGKQEASLIYLANPDNPMGTFHAPKKIEKLISQLPQNSVLCLDEAYGDFLPDGCSPNIAVDNPQVIRLRTFSKAYGMAGARIGYGIGEVSFIKAFDKIRNHFGVSRMSQAGAMASLEDDVHLNMVKKSVENAKVRIKSIADKNGLLTVPSATNFVAVDCRKDGNYAKSVLQELERQGIFVRMPSVAPLNRCIRISVVCKTGLDKLETAMPIALQISK